MRVPIPNSHSISVNVELKSPFTLEKIKALWEKQPGLVMVDDYKYQLYPTPLMATGTDAVYVGRLRRDYSVQHGINFWVVADNLRKGAATNAVQIAEILIKEQKTMIFKGSGVALVTPFTNDKVDYHKLERLIEWHLDMGPMRLLLWVPPEKQPPFLKMKEKRLSSLLLRRLKSKSR